MKKIEGLEERIYRYIVAYKRKNNGVSPTIKQIGTEFGHDSSSFIHAKLQILQDDGRIVVHDGRISRGITVTGSEWFAPDVTPPYFPSDTSRQIYDAVVRHAQINNGNSPSYRLIRDITHISSISIIGHHLKKLNDLGILRVAFGGVCRHISVPNSKWVGPKKAVAG